MNKTDMLSYASAFVSFILKPLEESGIKEIILFGSVARGDFDKKSDIDIFINLQNEKDSDEINEIVKKQLDKFYKSKISEIWRNKGIVNEFNVKAGVLDKWELKRSVIADGIVLFGRYNAYPENVEHYYLFVFQPIKDITKRNRVIRRLFGRKEGKSLSPGLIEEVKGKKLSPTSFIVPLGSSDLEIIGVLRKEKIDYKIYELWSDQFKG